MSIFRTETDINTGEIVVVEQYIYINGSGDVLVLDGGVEPPEGYELTDGLPEQAPIVPNIITMRQARLLLHSLGLLNQVQAAIDALPEPPRVAAQIEWDYSSEVHRNKEFVNMIAQALGLSDEQIDQMFIEAAQL